ncbi:MAG: M1 family aminopeptidase [Blastocatellia bacterium]
MPIQFCQRVFAALLLSFIACANVAYAQQETKAEKKKLPPANWMRSRTIDVKHIAIDLRFDWQKKQARGTTAVTLAPFQRASKITLDAAHFTINSVKLANGKPLKYEYDGGDRNDNLAITLDREYQPGEDLTVKIEYRTNWVNQIDPNNLWGSNGKGLRFSAPTSNDPNKPREIWSSGEPNGNRYWFPGYDAPDDLRTTEFIATVDKPLMAIFNGKLISVKDNTDGTRAFHWKADTPHANYLTSFVVGEYVDVKQNYEGIQLHNFGYPHERAGIAPSVVRLPEMVKFFSDVTGVKYPYPSYSQVFVQDLPGGMDNLMLSTITENMVDDDRTHADYLYLWDGQEAQSLAGQWFGNYVMPADWRHYWLNKSFARYFDCLFSEYKNSHDEMQLWNRLGDLNAYLSDWNSGVRRPVVTANYDSPETMTRDTYSFARGALTLHMLRKHLGEERWRKVIKHYLKTNANRSVTTEDFRQAAEVAAGEPMDWFFDQWLYKMGHPIFEVTKHYDAAKQQLTLNVRQTQKVDPNDEYPQVEFFRGKVEIEIDGRIEQVWLTPNYENVFTFAAAQQPKLVNFDYDSAWIKEMKFEKSLDELLYQLRYSKDALGKRTALNELVNLAKSEKTSAEDKAKIYAQLRSAAVSNAYWRLRMNAISQLQTLLAPASATNPVALDEATIAMLLTVIKQDKSWTRTTAINFLGTTRDPKFADLYISYLKDESDRVINAAAIALGKSKSQKAFGALAKLVSKPSWKNQSLMSSLVGLKGLGDPRGFDIAFKALSDLMLFRWRLPTPPVWDLRVFAAETIAALGKGEAAYPMIFDRFRKSLVEDDLEGIFNNALLITKLADPRGQEAFDLLKAKFKDDANATQAVNEYETQLKAAARKP